MRIKVTTTVAAPLEEVWRAYTTPADITQWNAASDDWHTTTATVDLRVGGAFASRMEAKDGSVGFDFGGTYTAVEPHAHLAYEFGDRTAEVNFRAAPDGIEVEVSFDPETVHPIEMQQHGWQCILDNFRRHVERSGRG